jgi:hypothetical protein
VVGRQVLDFFTTVLPDFCSQDFILANFEYITNPSAYQLDFIERLKARRKVEDEEAQEEGEVQEEDADEQGQVQ